MTKEEKREYMKQYNKQYYQANREQYTMDNVEPCCFDCNRKIG